MSKRRSLLAIVAAVVLVGAGYGALVFLRQPRVFEAERIQNAYVVREVSGPHHVLDDMSWRVFKVSGLWITKVVFADNGSTYAFTPTSAVYELEGLQFPYWTVIDRHYHSGHVENFAFPRSTKKRPSDERP
jgi:uncharacterized membrane protein